MNIKHKFAPILLTGVAIGLAAGTAIHAQQVKAPGYFVAGLEITDAAKFQTFVSQVPGTLAPFGGQYIVRPSTVSAVEGDPPKIFAIVAFDSVQQAMAWYHSRAYQAILPLRLSSAKTTAFIAEGMPPQ